MHQGFSSSKKPNFPMFFIRAPVVKALALRCFVKHNGFKRKMLSFLLPKLTFRLVRLPLQQGVLESELVFEAKHPTVRSAGTVFFPHPDTIRTMKPQKET